MEALIDALEDFEGAVVIVTHSELILRRLQLDQIVICEEAKQRHFLGDYDLFLEKIGWEEEKKAPAAKKTKSEPPPSIKAKSTKPLEKQIRLCEEKIIALEEEQKKDQEKLQQGNSSADLLKALGIRQKQIDALYKELDFLYQSMVQ